MPDELQTSKQPDEPDEKKVLFRILQHRRNLFPLDLFVYDKNRLIVHYHAY